VEDVEAWPERIGAVTAAEVNAAAAHVFRPEYSVTGRLVPAPHRTAASMPAPAVPPRGPADDGEIGAEQDANG
jgi:zinc protease